MLSIDQWLEEKPYREVYDNRIYEKTGGTFTHGVIMGQVAGLLSKCCDPYGGVGFSLRVYLAPGVSLCPDVAFLSDERLASLTDEERETPPLGPDIVAEIRAPEDHDANVNRKTELYLTYGSAMVLNVDPQSRTVYVRTPDGERVLHDGDRIGYPIYPEFSISVAEIFAPLDRRHG